MKERPNERLARHIVSTTLRLPVSRFEDGSANNQVDAVIHHPDGDAALEVIADHEDAFNAQWRALEKVGHRVHVPELEKAWSAQLARGAKVKDVVLRLPALVQSLQAAADDPSIAVETVQQELRRLGVKMLYPLEGSRTGYVNLHAEGWSGASSSLTMAQYVERVLRRAPDVPAKLAAHPAPQKHAFVWTTIGSEYAIQFQLEQGGRSLPEGPPELPTGVTHIWVAGSFKTQGVLAWFPERGWWRPDWAFPADGAVVLDD